MGCPGRGTRAWGWSLGIIWGWGLPSLCHHGPCGDDTEGVAPLWVGGTQGSWFWGDTEIWGALPSHCLWGPAVSASLLAIRAKERRAQPREGWPRSPGSSGAVPCFPGISWEGSGGRGGGAGRGGSEGDPWPCLALSPSRHLAECEGGRGWLLLGEKRALLSQIWCCQGRAGALPGQEGPGHSGMPGLSGQG